MPAQEKSEFRDQETEYNKCVIDDEHGKGSLSYSDSDGGKHCNVPLLTQCIPAVKIFIFPDLAKNISFLDDHTFTYFDILCQDFVEELIIRRIQIYSTRNEKIQRSVGERQIFDFVTV